MTEIVQFCRSRNGGRRCTRPLDHLGLHRHRAVMWTDAAADAARCPGSGAPAEAAPAAPDGYPHGRGLCELCLRFVEIVDGVLVEHDTSDAQESSSEGARRRDWFNTIG